MVIDVVVVVKLLEMQEGCCDPSEFYWNTRSEWTD